VAAHVAVRVLLAAWDELLLLGEPLLVRRAWALQQEPYAQTGGHRPLWDGRHR
jgi:hypothetical protein